jgi:hypothetical protein
VLQQGFRGGSRGRSYGEVELQTDPFQLN